MSEILTVGVARPKEEARKEAQAAAHGEEEHSQKIGSFEAKAAARLAEALQDGQAGRTLGEALAASFLKVWGNTPESAQRLRALLAAIRTNSGFRQSVLERGSEAEWERAGLAEAAPKLRAVERPCPECGGRAIYDSRAASDFKRAKLFGHFRCLEPQCGKETRWTE
eukprot:g13205.t1